MSGFRIDVADLLTHAGSRRDVSITVELDELGGDTWRIDDPVDVVLTLERIPDGIVARGTVRATCRSECSGCLADVRTELTVGVDELFEQHPLEGETYPIDDRYLDLEQLARDALLLELPLAPRCDEACAEPSTVGAMPRDSSPDERADLPGTSARTDPRWAALADLDLEAS